MNKQQFLDLLNKKNLTQELLDAINNNDEDELEYMLTEVLELIGFSFKSIRVYSGREKYTIYIDNILIDNLFWYDSLDDFINILIGEKILKK